MSIPISFPFIGEEEKNAVLEVLASGQLAQGKYVAEFEKKFADWVGVRHAVALSSGTAALHMAMLVHGFGPGDEIITSPYSFIASANCIVYVGARPVFADIEPAYFTLDPVEVERKITPITRAILAVHLYGQPCNMDALASIAERYNIFLIEDACQAHGAMFGGKKVGSWGTACFSFYATKNMTTGEGGMLTTNQSKVAEMARMWRDHGSPQRYVHEMLGYNLRMTEMQAALGLAQLAKIERLNGARRANAAYLSEHLRGTPGLTLPSVRPNAHHVYHQYTLRVQERDALANRLKDNSIGYGLYYPLPIHHQPIYRQMGYGNESLPNAEAACREVLSLPVHPSLSRAAFEKIVQVVKENGA